MRNNGIRNNMIKQELVISFVNTIIKGYRLQWTDHISRMEAKRLFSVPKRKRNVVWPCKRWLVIETTIGDVIYSWNEEEQKGDICKQYKIYTYVQEIYNKQVYNTQIQYTIYTRDVA